MHHKQTKTRSQVAAQYAKSSSSIIFKIATRSFLQRGAELKFLSAFPGEDEFLLPPLTCLRPTGKSQVINFQARNEDGGSRKSGDGGNLTEEKYTVIEVEPLQ